MPQFYCSIWIFIISSCLQTGLSAYYKKTVTFEKYNIQRVAECMQKQELKFITKKKSCVCIEINIPEISNKL